MKLISNIFVKTILSFIFCFFAENTNIIIIINLKYNCPFKSKIILVYNVKIDCGFVGEEH